MPALAKLHTCRDSHGGDFEAFFWSWFRYGRGEARKQIRGNGSSCCVDLCQTGRHCMQAKLLVRGSSPLYPHRPFLGPRLSGICIGTNLSYFFFLFLFLEWLSLKYFFCCVHSKQCPYPFSFYKHVCLHLKFDYHGQAKHLENSWEDLKFS